MSQSWQHGKAGGPRLDSRKYPAARIIPNPAAPPGARAGLRGRALRRVSACLNVIGPLEGRGLVCSRQAPGSDWSSGGGAEPRARAGLPQASGLGSVPGVGCGADLLAPCPSAASSGARFSRTTLSRVCSVTSWEDRGGARITGGVAALERRWSPGTPEGQTHGGRVWVKGVPEEGGAWGPGK